MASKGTSKKSQKPKTEMDSVAEGTHGAPSRFLGMHPHGNGVVVRAFSPYAEQVEVRNVDTGTDTPMAKIHPDGGSKWSWRIHPLSPTSFPCVSTTAAPW